MGSICNGNASIIGNYIHIQFYCFHKMSNNCYLLNFRCINFFVTICAFSLKFRTYTSIVGIYLSKSRIDKFIQLSFNIHESTLLYCGFLVFRRKIISISIYLVYLNSEKNIYRTYVGTSKFVIHLII